MIVIIAGPRDIANIVINMDSIVRSSGYEITKEVSGKANGVDALGEEWAIQEGIPVRPFKVHNVHWHQLGKQAGPMRNDRMAKYVADNGGGSLIAIWNGKSRGTVWMMYYALQRGLQIYAHYQDEAKLFTGHWDEVGESIIAAIDEMKWPMMSRLIRQPEPISTTRDTELMKWWP